VKGRKNGELTRRDGRGHEYDLPEDVEGVAGEQCQGEARGFNLYHQVNYREHVLDRDERVARDDTRREPRVRRARWMLRSGPTAPREATCTYRD